MPFGESEQDAQQKRTTMGLGFLVLGLILMMWAWGSWIYRTSTTARPQIIGRSAETTEETEKAIRIAPSMLAGGVLLVVVFLAATFVFVRSSRRYRQSLTRRGAAPTSASDVWSTHRLKDFDDSGG